MLEAMVGLVVLPPLVALGAVAGVEDDLVSPAVQAGLVPPDLPLLGHHPVLVPALTIRHT